MQLPKCHEFKLKTKGLFMNLDNVSCFYISATQCRRYKMLEILKGFSPLIEKGRSTVDLNKASLKLTDGKDGLIIHLRIPTTHRLIEAEKTMKLFLNVDEYKVAFVPAWATSENAAIRSATVRSNTSAIIRLGTITNPLNYPGLHARIRDNGLVEHEVVNHTNGNKDEFQSHIVTFSKELFELLLNRPEA